MKELLELIKSDLIQAKIKVSESKLNLFWLTRYFFYSRTIRVIVFLRLSQVDSVLVSAIARSALKLRFIEFGKVVLGKGIFLPHPQSIIVAGGVKIGDHVHIAQYVTIGGSFKKSRVMEDGATQYLPIIGNKVMIHPGAVIGGPVTIGDEVIIGANSVVTKDIPSNSIVYGQNQLANKKVTIPKEGGVYAIMEDL